MVSNPILCYHGVTDSPSIGIENCLCKHIRSEEFDRQMRHIRENMRPISLRNMVDCLEQVNLLSQNLIAVTFDDSYRNVHEVAMPILKKYEIPATFFISTGFLDSDRRYWTDKLEYFINNTAEEEMLNEYFYESPNKIWELNSDQNRIEALAEIKMFLKKMDSDKRDNIIASLQNQLKVSGEGNNVSNYQNLSSNHVIALDQSELFEIGGHSVNHEILSYLKDDELAFEINQCLKDLEKILGHSVDLFSYPEGQSEHYDRRVIETLKKAGVKICPSAMYGFNTPGMDAFNLKRIMVGFMNNPFPWEGIGII